MHDIASINWRSRGYLPHFDAEDVPQHIVIGLLDALTSEIVERDPIKRLWEFDRQLDSGFGNCALKHPDCAKAVQDELLHHDGDRYRLLAWCVMPNHVHVVVDGLSDPGGTIRRWKSWSARQINNALGLKGPVWRREYFDRFARNEAHLRTMVHYVENNPVAAGLVATQEEWRWSSAAYRPLAGQAPGGPRFAK